MSTDKEAAVRLVEEWAGRTPGEGVGIYMRLAERIEAALAAVRTSPVPLTAPAEVARVTTSTGHVIDRKGEKMGDVWCAVTVHGLRTGCAAWLPIDEPMGASVAVTVTARKG